MAVTQAGYYGEFGGRFVAETLVPALEELERAYEEIVLSSGFQREWHALLDEYVGRPTPLYRADRLARAIDPDGRTLAGLWLKREDLCHTGAHKINNALEQVLLAKKLGKARIIAETGAGQHGVAIATAAAMIGLPCEVYMGAVDVARQAPNVGRMRMLGAKVIPVESGSRTLKDAMDFFDRHNTGFWPVILVRSATAASMTLRSATASPTPMFTVILVILGISMTFFTPKSCLSFGTTVFW